MQKVQRSWVCSVWRSKSFSFSKLNERRFALYDMEKIFTQGIEALKEFSQKCYRCLTHEDIHG